MDVWLLYGLAAAAANLPFWEGRRRFFGLPLFRGDKAFGWVFLEWLLAFGLWIALAMGLEARLQPVHPQDWPFWTVNLCLFAVFAFPGFVVRYLWSPRTR